jgi:hypothetical protein
MDKELMNRIDDEVERNRKALVYYAKASDWEKFKSKAGVLFDYLEWTELTVLEQKFFKVFKIILFILMAAVIAFYKLDAATFPALVKYKGPFGLALLAGACYELYFFLDFQWYVRAKIAWRKKRREKFIRDMENDFKEFVSRGNPAT